MLVAGRAWSRISGKISNTPLARMARRVVAAAARLRADRRGSIAIFVALALVPLIGGIGIGIDSARAYLVRARLSQALDAAGLAGGRTIGDQAQATADINMYFKANFPQGYLGATVTDPAISYTNDGQDIQLSATATIPATLMQVLGQTTIQVKATNTITKQNSGLELVLVMDNTGSMNSNGKLTAMKNAATSLVNTIYGAKETVPNLYVGVVPFVAMVNIGNSHGSWTTTPSYTTYTVAAGSGSSKQLTRTTNSGPSSPGTSTVCVTVTADFDGDPKTGGLRDGMMVDIAGASQSAYNGRRQIRTGTANSTTGCTIDSGNYKRRFWYLINTTSGTTPATGSITVKRPTVTYPSIAAWKGCVELRDDPYETTSADAAPGTAPFPKAFSPSTKNVRWFDTDKTSSRFKYMMKTGSSSTSYVIGDNEWTTSSVNENTSSSSYGPNKGCPTPITPLQPNKSTALSAISNMAAWYGGGTAVPAGLAWGWRVLAPSYRGQWGSPTPADLPLDYNTDKMSKVVVLLTDGKNEVVNGTSNGDMPGCNGTIYAYNSYDCPVDSEYAAYGRMSERRFGASVDSKTEFTTELNNRISSLCSAMKVSSKGIVIYTILLQVNDTDTQNIYKNCASKPEYYFESPTADELAGIFNTIAVQLSKLRLAR